MELHTRMITWWWTQVMAGGLETRVCIEKSYTHVIRHNCIIMPYIRYFIFCLTLPIQKYILTKTISDWIGQSDSNDMSIIFFDLDTRLSSQKVLLLVPTE